MDALSYTQLGESNISSKLPEIAMRQYKIAEANREKTEKQHTDLIGLFKYKVEGFNPDITGLTKGYEAIVQKGSEIALKQGYSAAQQYVQTQKDLLDGIGKMSSAQKEKAAILYKDLSDEKKWGQATPESRMKSTENYKKYVMANEPTKEDYANIRKKYGYSDAIPDEALRAVVRQNSFSEGEGILDFKSEIKLFSPEDITPYQSTSVIEGGSASIGKDKAGNTVMNKYDSKREDKEKTLAGITNYLINPITKEGYTYGQVPIKQMYEKGMLSPKAKEYYEKGDINTAGKITASELPDNVKAGFFKGSTGSKQDQQYIKEKGGFNFNFGSGYGENDKYNMSSDVSKNVSTPTTGDKQKDISLPTVVINKVGSEAVAVTIPTPEYIEVYNPAKKSFEQKTNRAGQITVDDYELRKHDNGWYLHGTSVMNTGEKKSKTDKSVTPIYTKVNVAIPISNNLSVISKRFGFEPEQLEDVMNTAIDKYTGMYPNQTTHKKTYEYIGKENKTNNQSTPTQQKTSNKKTTVSGGSIR